MDTFKHIIKKICLIIFFFSFTDISFAANKKIIRHRGKHKPNRSRIHVNNVTTDALWKVYDKVTLDQEYFKKNVLDITVPSTIMIANVKVTLTSLARHKIKREINKRLSNKQGIEKLVSLANLYIPVINSIFKENNFPSDLKYIMLLESGCIGNARSNSIDSAVGYWQFKSCSAKDVGLTINRDIDERMNIVSSTKGFIRYMMRSNKKFNNWVFCIMAFYLGHKGAEDLLIKKLKLKNSKSIKIDHRWHFYIYTFIAYKLVFNKLLKDTHKPKVRLYGARHCNGKTVAQVCKKYKMRPDVFHVLNKWLKIDRIPYNNKNTIIILA